MNGYEHSLGRREFLELAAVGAAALALPMRAQAAAEDVPFRVSPFPLEAVRLKTSPFMDAVNANLGYLHRLEPDRLLHNFRVHAGLKPKGEAYGGWEADTIAGHSLGHYLTAVSLMHAQTGDEECKRRALYIIDELSECQAASGEGYVAGFTRKIGEKVENGRIIFDEFAKGDIKQAAFYLNGCWVPFYNWHKMYSGLFEAQTHCGSEKALKVAVDLAVFIKKVFDGFDDAQLEKVLSCEHGGIAESMAELYARTKDQKWLDLAIRIRHHRTLDPMFAEEDKLAHLHANTQIPKVVGLARIYELTQKPEYATAAKFFWNTVTSKYSYVIGGNADRESFQLPNTISKYITEETCESCNTYNMLRLTRHLYQWEPRSSYLDYYERAHFNHILAQENPKTGMFAYMVPLMAGASRGFSSETNDFWCCVGSGMESHSKHGDSIYWQSEDHLVVGLFIPSTLEWKEQDASFELQTAYPFSDTITLKVLKAPKKQLAISMRVPEWSSAVSFKINGKEQKYLAYYATARRKWRAGDMITLTLSLKPRIESTDDDPNTIALLQGPLVLAADLGPTARERDAGPAPALVGSDLLGSLKPAVEPASFTTAGSGRPGELTLKPFYSQWERRTAVYFKKYTEDEWIAEQKRVAAEAERLKDLERRSVDVIVLGDRNSEREHSLASNTSYGVTYRGKRGRDARTGGFFEFAAKVVDEDLTLRATYWGEESKRLFHISVDGKRIASETLGYGKVGEFVERDYAIPRELVAGKATVKVRFEPETGNTAGPVFGVLIFKR
jgi:DUF1680 family protein